jgi:hypothetical protein
LVGGELGKTVDGNVLKNIGIGTNCGDLAFANTTHTVLR